MDKKTRYQHMCVGKLRHDTRELAEVHVKTLKREKGPKRGGFRIQSYLCEFCKHWHVGHSSTKKNRKHWPMRAEE